MHIEQLALKHFRNYQSLDMTFKNKVNVIIGENAQGKTNLMEAMYTLAFTKSHRTSKEKELIQWDADFARIDGRILKRNQSIPLDITISSKGKKARLNRLEQRRLSDYIGALNIVMFAPEDLGLVKGPPQNRRRFIDMELGQIQPRYIYHLGLYQKILRQRNHLLKQLQRGQTRDRTMLHVLTDQLAVHAAALLSRRFKFLERLRTWAEPIHYSISRELENLEILYMPTIDVSEETNEEKIGNAYISHFQSIEDKEVERGTTLIGPHRDDLVFHVNGRDVQTYGSQGQQRTTALSLKLAEIELIYNEIGEYPILLLDDVLSELDDFRQSHLLNTIQGKVQTFVSTTTVDGIDHKTLREADIFRVHDGMIRES
ncbi:DNA replication and repair protein RecF [Lentibacillus sp. JNUCC-1]|uniref:DNA replication/repair protein RecF n=1 Tax=Lentibacillus sp. JNUCC-1 TaxID=2654513 RepID=UPI0012E84527|nr:DNA replication/repair protein RecF [Lentibacillus sp. JNUCC-1]MUV37951.1 DNA replication and repair protein RecF [Lentibacillus sp. JNUCC-1]